MYIYLYTHTLTYMYMDMCMYMYMHVYVPTCIFVIVPVSAKKTTVEQSVACSTSYRRAICANIEYPLKPPLQCWIVLPTKRSRSAKKTTVSVSRGPCSCCQH